jgi:hypothetical protein
MITRVLTVLLGALVAFNVASAQTPAKNNPRGAMSSEKSILTAPKVSLNFCVRAGRVSINGWDRDEVRVFVAGGTEIAVDVMQEDPVTKRPVWLNLAGIAASKTKGAASEGCLAGDEIALDVPRNASIKLKSGESDVRIGSVGRVSVETLNGNIMLSDIASGVEATTFRGDMLAERVGGRVILNSNAGNIVVIGAGPVEIDDSFNAKAGGGVIHLRSIAHRLIETSSLSGSTIYEGELLRGGQYRFNGTSGTIIMSLKTPVSCRLTANFGFGSFASEIPLVGETRRDRGLTAAFSSAETTCGVTVTSVSGTIRIRPQS